MWIVCQIGAREHYAIPRALRSSNESAVLFTDFWIDPSSLWNGLPIGRRLKDRFHPDLADGKVFAPNLRILAFEMRQRFFKCGGWPLILKRNEIFQRRVLGQLVKSFSSTEAGGSPITLFSYSYAARDLFRFAKDCGWNTVLGQIDPGPEEERIVVAEHRRYPKLGSRWEPAPASYWESWREEIGLADRILVNSDWSKHCLLKEGVSSEKMEIVPLVYDVQGAGVSDSNKPQAVGRDERPLRVLFLGQINLRKGMGRLLDAMRLLRNEAIELILAGPCEIDPASWSDLPNVKWVGPVPRSEVGKSYAAADVFILPTLSDGYALTQLEALSRGLPLIVSRQCGEAVEAGKNGWILSDTEPETLADALRKAAASSILPSGGGYQRFSLSELGRQLLHK